MEEALRKVLLSYGLVKDNEGLNSRLIDRVVKIVLKEFEVKNKFEVDDGPISLTDVANKSETKAAVVANPAQAHFAKTIANATKNNKVDNLKKIAKEAFSQQDPPVEDLDTKEEDEIIEESEPSSNEGVEMILDSGTPIPATRFNVLPSRLDDSAEQKVTKSGVKSIRRIE